MGHIELHAPSAHGWALLQLSPGVNAKKAQIAVGDAASRRQTDAAKQRWVKSRSYTRSSAFAYRSALLTPRHLGEDNRLISVGHGRLAKVKVKPLVTGRHGVCRFTKDVQAKVRSCCVSAPEIDAPPDRAHDGITLARSARTRLKCRRQTSQITSTYIPGATFDAVSGDVVVLARKDMDGNRQRRGLDMRKLSHAVQSPSPKV